MQWATRCIALQNAIAEFVGRAISWLCLGMIAALIYEVTVRYLFMSPTDWAHEATTMLYGAFGVLAGVYAHRHHGHVRSEVIYHLFPPRGRAVLDILTGLIGLVALSVFLLIAAQFAWDSWVMREVSSKSTWAPPIYPFKAILPLAVALLILQSLAHLAHDLMVLFNLQPPDKLQQYPEEAPEGQTQPL